MLIIDKNKDYYDYNSHVYGVDNKVVYDRRGSTVLTDKTILELSIGEYLYRRNFIGVECFFIIEIAETQYLFIIKNIDVVDKNISKVVAFPEVSGNISLYHIFKEGRNIFGNNITFIPVSIAMNFFVNRGSCSSRYNLNSFNEAIQRKKDNLKIINPIFRETCIPSMIDSFDVWKQLSNFISSKNNEKNVNVAMADVEKAVNHGFDKKTSFRNPIR